MILAFRHNLRLDKDGNISISSEQVVDGIAEAEDAGRDFASLSQAFLKGYGDALGKISNTGTSEE